MIPVSNVCLEHFQLEKIGKRSIFVRNRKNSDNNNNNDKNARNYKIETHNNSRFTLQTSPAHEI